MTASKKYIDANSLTRDSFLLGKKIYDSGFRPDVIIGLWRGGTPVAVAVQEILHYKQVSCYHTALKTQAYTGIGTHKKPVVENLVALRSYLTPESKVLVIDDIFDSGDTAAAMKEALGPLVGDLKIATLYYKPKASKQNFAPDFYIHETDEWIVFPHELVGLSPDEIQEKDPLLSALIEN